MGDGLSADLPLDQLLASKPVKCVYYNTGLFLLAQFNIPGPPKICCDLDTYLISHWVPWYTSVVGNFVTLYGFDNLKPSVRLLLYLLLSPESGTVGLGHKNLSQLTLNVVRRLLHFDPQVRSSQITFLPHWYVSSHFAAP
ncbi:protein ORF68 [Lake sturgeon herpesvirus]|nr:protein ORF68 [Lake sturgeon herpesvirus]